jgi:formylglycine-generating enzyme required for sulfatase activity
MTPVDSVSGTGATADQVLSEPGGPDGLLEAIPGMFLVNIPAGNFVMGSTDAQVSAAQEYCNTTGGCSVESLALELPHQMTYLEEYSIGRTEVTNAQYRAFVEGGGYADPSWWTEAGWQWRTLTGFTQPDCWDDPALNQPDQPVVCASWYEAVAYARWLSQRTGREFRLPTEAEWEKAARGSDGRVYPWGEGAANGLHANLCDAICTNSPRDAGIYDGYELTAPVGSFPVGTSAYGVQDMAGNAFEWTASEWRVYPYVAADGRESTDGIAARVLRGGSFYHRAGDAHCAARLGSNPDTRSQVAGFRLALSPP